MCLRPDHGRPNHATDIQKLLKYKRSSGAGGSARELPPATPEARSLAEQSGRLFDFDSGGAAVEKRAARLDCLCRARHAFVVGDDGAKDFTADRRLDLFHRSAEFFRAEPIAIR